MARKRKKVTPKIKKVKKEELSSLLERARSNSLTEEDCEVISGMAETIEFIIEKLHDKDAKLKQLLKQILGIKTEKSSKIVAELKNEEEVNSEEKVEVAIASEESSSEKKKKGHGKKSVKEYAGAENVWIEHAELKSGDGCPECGKGKVYREKNPGVFIHIEGKPPIQATVYRTEKLRCNLCGEIFEADLPVEAPAQKHYDETAKAMMAILKYAYGVPWYRLEKLQEGAGIPLAASTAWDKTAEAAEKIYPVYEELIGLSAQGGLIHTDDTGMKVLKTMKEIAREEKAANGKKIRKGIFTTGIVSEFEKKKIALFFTGRKHAGENYDGLMKQRESDRSPPLYSCDGKNGNKLKNTPGIVCNCNVHARRNFVEVAENFPDECLYVLVDVYKKIYENEAHTKQEKMSVKERLEYHREKSKPIMDKYHLWLKRQFKEKLVEENSGLGKAIKYTLKRWKQLTRFLHTPGAPLDNNICEQALKTAIIHRKNSLFYKTPNGARVGDMFMSLIHTCYYHKANPFDYFTELQRHWEDVMANPSKWLPWNYQAQLEILS